MRDTALERQFMAVYEAHQEAVFRHCYFRVFHRERAKEIMQEAFMRTWEEVERGRGIENLRAFVYRVASNLIIDERRKRQETSLDALQDGGFDPTAEQGDVHLLLDAKAAAALLPQLPHEYREAVSLRYVDGLPPREIAEILEENVNVVSVRIHRGLKELKKLLRYV